MLQYLKMRVYRDAEDTEGREATLEYVVNRLMYGGSYTAVTFSGTFPRGERSDDAFEVHTGLIALHLLYLPVKTMPEVLEKLRRLPGFVLAFRPPREVAILSCIFRVDPLPRDPAEHVNAFEAVKAALRDLKRAHRFTIANRGANCSDLSYIRQDAQSIKNYSAEPFVWRYETPQDIQQHVPVAADSAGNEGQEQTLIGLRPEDLTASHSIQDFQRVVGCSYEYARQLWHQAGGKEYRDSKETELVDGIQKLDAEGHSQRAIAEILGIKRNKVRRVLNEIRGRKCNTS